MPDQHVVQVKVWGEFACFTRPDMKVERVSYPVMTPSAARGILEAILWKPEFRWWVRAIHVLKLIQFIPVRRNEVEGKASIQAIANWIKGKKQFSPLFADSDEKGKGGRTQRNTVALRDVAYLIEASIHLPNGFSAENPPVKYREMFERRVEKGQCHARPVLGCREFAADFGPPDGSEQPIPDSRDLGLMLLDVIHPKRGERAPRFFAARLEQGILHVPDSQLEAFWKEVIKQ
jgi:CRISPR-associated protein Cas5d